MTVVYEDHEDDAGTGIPVRRIRFTINGQKKIAEVEPRLLLAHLIRRGLGLTGTHMGCDTTNCGACTVLVDGRPVKSCTMLAVQADGREISTVEGLATASELHPLQEGFKEEHGLQCGFCTPGMMMAAKALLDENPDPTEEDVRWALSGNLCRCTGYQNIVKSVLWAADKLRAVPARGDDPPEPPDSPARGDTPAAPPTSQANNDVPARGDDPPLHSPGGLPPEPPAPDSPARGETPAAPPASQANNGQEG